MQAEAQLRGEELVRIALFDQQRQFLPRARHQFASVIRLPRVLILAQVGREGFLPPRHP